MKVCDHALLYATAAHDLSFALRICQYIDEEGLWCDVDVRDALCRAVRVAIKKLPETAAVTTTGDGATAAAGGAAWKVEGTNATVEELKTLGTLLQGWLDSEMAEFEFDDEEEEGKDGDGNEEGVVVADSLENKKVGCCAEKGGRGTLFVVFWAQGSVPLGEPSPPEMVRSGGAHAAPPACYNGCLLGVCRALG